MEPIALTLATLLRLDPFFVNWRRTSGSCPVRFSPSFLLHDMPPNNRSGEQDQRTGKKNWTYVRDEMVEIGVRFINISYLLIHPDPGHLARY